MTVSTADALLARDRYLRPIFFGPFADDLARRLARISTGPLLEIVADTGVLTQALASAMSAGLTIIATDPDPGAVAHASGKPGLARIAWQIADPRALPFSDGTFGIVTCHFGVVSLPDRIQAYKEVRRILKSGGRFVFSVPGDLTHNPVADCLQDAMNALFPADPPGFLERVLHGYAEAETIDDDLTAAGFTDAIYTTVDLRYAVASARDAVLGYCRGTALCSEIENRVPGDSERVIDAAIAALERRFGSGPIATSMRAQVVSASG